MFPEANQVFNEDDVREYKRLGDKFARSRFRKVQAMSAYFNLNQLQRIERLWEISDGEPFAYYDMLFQIAPVTQERIDEAIEGAGSIFNEDSTEALVNSYKLFTRAARFFPFNSFHFFLDRASPLRAFDEPGGYARAYELDWNRPKNHEETEQRIWEALDAVNTFINMDNSVVKEDALNRFFLVNSISPNGWEFHSSKSRTKYSRSGFGFRKGMFEYPEAEVVVDYPELLVVLEFAGILMDFDEIINEKKNKLEDTTGSRILETLIKLAEQADENYHKNSAQKQNSQGRMLQSINLYGLGNFISTIVMSKARSFIKNLKFKDQDDKDSYLDRAYLMSQELSRYLES